MSIDYQINFTDESLNGKGSFVIPQEQVNENKTSLSLFGYGYANYGEKANENFVKLLENFASNGTPPANPTIGQLWFDASTNTLKVNKTGGDTGWASVVSGTLTEHLTLHANPTANMHAATKQYVDSKVADSSTHNHDTLYVNVSGDTMTGFLTLHANPTANMHAATKQYVDNAVTSSGGISIPSGSSGAIGYSNGTSLLFSTIGTPGQVLISGGTGAPTWQSVASANTANTIVARDASGNFSAGTITANLNGTATSATNLTGTSTTSIPSSALGTGTADNTTFLRGDRTWVNISIGGSGYRLKNIVRFTSPGSGTYNKPADVNALWIRAVGGGGGGGPDGGNGGGAGGYAEKFITSPVGSYAYTVGAGGAAGNPGATGGTTTIAGMSCAGGSGGSGAGGGNIGNGGVATGGDVNIRGGGGSGGGEYGGGCGGSSVFGGGGTGGGVHTAGGNGVFGGGGGGGGGAYGDIGPAGGSGGSGYIEIWEFV